MAEDDALIDQLYEAAFIPEHWPALLDELAARSGSAAGQLLVFDDIAPVQLKASALTYPIAREVMQVGWQTSRRISYFFKTPCYGFVRASEYFPRDVREDESYRLMTARGFEAQLGTIIPMPGGELAVFAFERWRQLGPHEDPQVERMNAIYPHLARAALVASRLGLERARSAVSTLEALGVPAAAMTRSGKVVAVNGLLETVAETVMPVAFGGLAISEPSANRLFQDAIAGVLADGRQFVLSIPIPPQDDRPPQIVHVLPLINGARDMLFGAEILVAVTHIRPDSSVPRTSVLRGLFDFTPSEARLAMSLATGKSLRQSAADMGIGFGSARTYLAHIFAKTGTNQQSQLVSLLKSSQPIAQAEAPGDDASP